MSKTREVRPFGARDKFGYLFGDLANDFSFIFASTYVMVFYTKVMGISAAMVGTMFLIARCIDAFTDIGMGRIVDNSKPTKNGRIRPWILRMCGFVALASFMMYQSFLVDASYREQVLGSAEQTWTLPSPFAFIVLVIFAMALPQGDVPVLQSFGYFVRAGGVYHPRCSFIFCV